MEQETKKIAIDAIIPIAKDGVQIAGKDNKIFGSQLRKCYLSFREKPQTMLECSREVGIERASICRYVATLRKNDLIKLIGFGLCSISLHRAGYYSTDPDLFIQTKKGGES